MFEFRCNLKLRKLVLLILNIRPTLYILYVLKYLQMPYISRYIVTNTLTHVVRQTIAEYQFIAPSISVNLFYLGPYESVTP